MAAICLQKRKYIVSLIKTGHQNKFLHVYCNKKLSVSPEIFLYTNFKTN